MAGFTVLTDSDMKSLLRKSGPQEIEHFASILLETLQNYSTKDESQYQLHRSSIERNAQTTLFMPSSLSTSLGIKVVGLPTPKPGAKGNLVATLLICNAKGEATGVLNAGELTAFRTSLGAMLLFQARKNVKNVVMFGSGNQAYWHLRLAIILKGKDIGTITIVNRSRDRAQELLVNLKSDDTLLREHSHITISTFVTSEQKDDAALKSIVTNANSIHCGVPSTEPLFPAEWLTSTSGVKRDLYISAIGSYQLHMREIDPEYLKQIVSSSDLYVPKDRKTPVVVIDSLSGCFAEAGELVDAGLREENLLEIGQLAETRQDGGSQELEDWLSTGLVVYKSVGMGIMDICIGNALIELARQKNVGVTVSNF